MPTVKVQQAYLFELRLAVDRAADRDRAAADLVSTAANRLSRVNFSPKDPIVGDLRHLGNRLQTQLRLGNRYCSMIRDISNEMAAVDKSLNASSQGILGLVSSWVDGKTRSMFSLATKSKINKQTATAALFLAGGETVFGAMDIWDRLLDKTKNWLHIPRGNSKGGAGAAKLNLADKINETVQRILRPVKQKDVDSFVNWSLDEKNWTAKPGGAPRGIDSDNVYGEQCADISKEWYYRMYGERTRLSAWNDSGTAPGVNFINSSKMDDVTGGPYLAGDIGFTICHQPKQIGHTFVIVSDQDANGKVMILDQNPHSPTKREIPVSDITHAYRKKLEG